MQNYLKIGIETIIQKGRNQTRVNEENTVSWLVCYVCPLSPPPESTAYTGWNV